MSRKREIKCTRCRNHGQERSLKGHKRNCPFRYCACRKCAIVSERISMQLALRKQENSAYEENNCNSQAVITEDHSDSFSSSSETMEKNYKRETKCSRCRNHGVDSLRRGHKWRCQFQHCTCPKCSLIIERNITQLALKKKQKREKLDNDLSVDNEDEISVIESSNLNGEETKRRKKPLCQRCKAHNEIAYLKYHKNSCKYQFCQCEKCRLISQHRRVMANQVWLLRQQKLSAEMPDQPIPSKFLTTSEHGNQTELMETTSSYNNTSNNSMIFQNLIPPPPPPPLTLQSENVQGHSLDSYTQLMLRIPPLEYHGP